MLPVAAASCLLFHQMLPTSSFRSAVKCFFCWRRCAVLRSAAKLPSYVIKLSSNHSPNLFTILLALVCAIGLRFDFSGPHTTNVPVPWPMSRLFRPPHSEIACCTVAYVTIFPPPRLRNCLYRDRRQDCSAPHIADLLLPGSSPSSPGARVRQNPP